MYAKCIVESEPYYFGYKSTRQINALPIEHFHFHSGLEVLYIYEGIGQVVLEDRLYSIAPHTLIFFKPYQLHYLRMSQISKYTCTLLKVNSTLIESSLTQFPYCQSLVSRFLNEPNYQQVFQLDASRSNLVEAQLHHLNEMLQTDQQKLRVEAVIVFILQLFMSFITNILPASLENQGIKPLRTNQTIHEILKWINIHYKQPYTVNQIAEELYLSANYMSKLFRQQIGKSIPEFITEKRLEQARSLLHNDRLSIEEISKASGFNSSSYFIRVFKSKHGITPHRYRLNLSEIYPAK